MIRRIKMWAASFYDFSKFVYNDIKENVHKLFKKKSVKRPTYNIEITEQGFNVIKDLGKRIKSDNYGYVIAEALALYDVALSSVNEGRIVAAVDETALRYYEIEVPSIRNLKSEIPWGTWQDKNEKFHGEEEMGSERP